MNMDLIILFWRESNGCRKGTEFLSNPAVHSLIDSDGPAYHIVHDRRDQLWMKIVRHSLYAGRYIISLPLLLRNKLDALHQTQIIYSFIKNNIICPILALNV